MCSEPFVDSSIDSLPMGRNCSLGHAVWLAGDPAKELVHVKQAIIEAEAHREAHRAAVARQREAAHLLSPRVDGLRTLIGEAMLLDPPDHSERARTLDVERDAARSAKEGIAKLGRHAEFVDRHLSALRQLPLSNEDVQRLQKHVHALKARREQLDAAGLDALSYVQTNVDALGWDEAPRRLADNHALVPALKAQLGEAEAEQKEGRRCSNGFRAALRRVHPSISGRGRREALGCAGARCCRRALRARGVLRIRPSRTWTRLPRMVKRLEQELQTQGERRDVLLTAKGEQDGSLRAAEASLRTAEERLTSDRREAEPAVKRWEALQRRATRERLMGGLIDEAAAELSDVRGHVNLVQAAANRRDVLLERLRLAQGGVVLLTELQLLRDTSRRGVRRCVPRAVAGRPRLAEATTPGAGRRSGRSAGGPAPAA